MATTPHRTTTPRSTMRAAIAAATTFLMTAGTLVALPAPASAAPNADTPYPVFTGDPNPVPDAGADFAPGGYLEAIFDADAGAGAGSSPDQDFWIDQMLARYGTAGSSGDNNQWLFTRGRALFMKTHAPGQLGFGGDAAYWESIDGRGAYSVGIESGGTPVALSETTAQRKQTPSYWNSTHTGAGLTVDQTKFITDGNVAVTVLDLTNTGSADATVTVSATSPYTTVPEGDELTGAVDALNDLTRVFPRLSGDGFSVANGAIERELTIPAGDTVTTKVQMGFITDELPQSEAEYAQYAAAAPWEAYATHVTAYNRWWVDNVPYLDTPEDNIDKVLFYRWWLMRFNFLDADIPGNDFQFPTSMEGVLGYNNAIVLTVGMFIDDLKYLRDPVYSYGPWVSAGETSKSGKFVDNPGDPANWSNSYTQYISEAAWRAYQLHGGPAEIAGNLARYAEYDVKDLLADFDGDGNNLIEYNWGAMTGNDADAVSFDWRAGNLDRAESAYLYSNALAAAEAYRTAGQPDKAAEMEVLADDVKQAVLDYLWDADENLLKHRHVATDALVPWKEINNYYPFTVGLMPREGDADYDDDYVEALRLFAQDDQYPIFPFYTANQADKAEAAAEGDPGSNNFSVINSTVTFRMLASVLRDYPTEYVDAEWYKKLLYWNAWSHYQNGGDNRLPDQNEFWADGSADPQSIGYRSWIHHTILGATNFTMIEDAMGLRPRDDGKIELDPIDIGWDHFAADNIRYRDRDLAVVWDAVDHYGAGVADGYSVYLDGTLAFSVDALAHVVYDPATGTVDAPAGVTVTASTTMPVQSPSEVRFADDARVVSMMAKAGADIATASTGGANLAEGAEVSATYASAGRVPEAAVNGTTINEPFWGTAGSPHDTDTLTVELGAERAFDDVRLYFYRSSSTATVAGYAEPAMYAIEYRSDGDWQPVPGQARFPAYPQGNLNQIAFPEVTGDAVRVTVTHADGARTGLKEIQVRATGADVTGGENLAPSVQAWQDTAASSPGEAALAGTVKDDGLPAGQLEAQWSVIDAPEGALAVFADASSAATTVRYSAPGTYVLRLTATDGEASAFADVTVAGEAASAGANVAVSATPTAEYTAGWNNVNAVNDGAIAHSGGDQTAVWATWSGNHPATRWLQYEWAAPVRVSATEVSFWADQTNPSSSAGVNVPESWKAQYWDGTAWVDVPGADTYAVARTAPNTTTFDAVTTTRLRLVLSAAGGNPYAAVGVSEWKVFADTPVAVEPIDVRTTVGQLPDMPATVDMVFDDGSRAQGDVSWAPIEASDVAGEGSFNVTGLVAGSPLPAQATVWVRLTAPGQINQVDAVAVDTLAGVAPQLPGTVGVLYNDGSREDLPVVWDAIDPASYADDGVFTVDGTVDTATPGSTAATATVTVTGGTSAPDTTAPVVVVSAAEAPASGWHVGDVEVQVGATDARDGDPLIEVSLDGSSWSAYAGPLTVTGDGDHEVRARATDAAGNVSSVSTLAVPIDTTAPEVSAVADEYLRTVTVTATDSASGVESVEYRVDGGAWTAYEGAVLVGVAAAVVEYRATDVAGHTSNVGQIDLDEATDYSLNLALAAVASASVTAGWNTVDGLNDNVQPTSSGDATPNDNSHVWGAWPEIGEQWVQYDWAEPVTFDRIAVYFVSNLDDAGLGIDVPADWQAEAWDASTETWVPVQQPSGYGTEVDGYNEVTFDEVTTSSLRLTMTARGTESGAGSLGIKEWQVWQDAGQEVPDTEPPTVSVSIAPEAPASGWHTTPVVVTATAVDGRDPSPAIEVRADGGDWVAYDGPVSLADDGTVTYTVRATDAAGNVSDTSTVTVAIDATAPTVAAEVDEDDRTVTLVGVDGGSGLELIEHRAVGTDAWVAYAGPIVIGAEATTLEFRATDRAGNVGALRSVEIDAADPGGPGGPGDPGDQTTGDERLVAGVTRVAPGDSVPLELTGGVPGATFVIELRSDPVQLGTLTLGTDGSGTGTFTIPADTPAGDHLLVAVLGDVEISVPMVVAVPGEVDGGDGAGDGDAGSSGDGLSSTGPTAGTTRAAGLAVLLVLAGLGAISVAVLITRRRGGGVTTED